MVVQYIRIVQTGVRFPPGPPMRYLAVCEGCGYVHPEIFWTPKDQVLLYLIVFHSERQPAHKIKIVEIPDTNNSKLQYSDKSYLPLIVAQIEPDTYLTA